MATGTRVRQDFIEGTLISNLSTSATAMESDGLADLTVIDNATNNEYAAAVIGDEVVHVITHESAATTAEIQRGQEGTAAAAHDAGAAWHHGPTEDDFTELKSGASSEGFEAYRSTAQSLSAATWTKVVPDTEVRDQGGDYDPSTGEWTVPADGWYDVSGSVFFASLSSGEVFGASLYVNGSRYRRIGGTSTASSSSSYVLAASVSVYLTAGDVVALYAYRGSAGDVGSGADSTYFTAVSN